MLQDRQRRTLFQFLDVMRKILSECVDQQSIEQIESELNLALALMERDFPPDIQVCTDISDVATLFSSCFCHNHVFVIIIGYNSAPTSTYC